MNKNERDISYLESQSTLVGEHRKELLDIETGEVIHVDQITKLVYGSKNFWKVYLMDFLSILGIFDSRQVDIFIYIVSNTNQANNLFIGTYKHIADELGVSQTTIAKIMKKLQEHGFIRKVQNGVWLINPNILMRGNDKKRQILLNYYESNEPINQITMKRVKTKQPIQLPGQMKIADVDCNIEEE